MTEQKNIAKSLELLCRNTDEVIGLDDIEAKIDLNMVHAYWGTAPTGAPHLAYLVPLLKVRDCIRAGCYMTILLADVHSYMDEGAHAISRAEQRTRYYELIMKELLLLIGVDPSSVKFVKGSDYQFDRKYCIDLFRFSSMLGVRDAKRAGSEVVKKNSNPRVSTLLYPLMQCLDETILDADIEIGGRDQRKIFALSRDYKEKLGYEKTSYLITPLIPSLLSKGKMSASSKAGKIEFTDSPEEIREKISKAFSVDKETDLEKNSLLALLRYIIFPIQRRLDVLRDIKYGGDITYSSYADLEEDWKSGGLCSADLKPAVAESVERLVRPIREKIESNLHILEAAYPSL